MVPKGITMSLLIKTILIQTLHQISLESNILDQENVKLSLQYLCPGVDICNRNALNTNVNPNEVDERGFMSCCQACSCYNDCHINMNCCFPAEREAISHSNTSFVNINAPIERRNSSLVSDKNSLLWNEDSIDTNFTTHDSTNGTLDINRGIKMIHQGNMAFDKSNISIDIELPTKQCMYIKTGTTDELWVGQVPSVRMVTSPPPGGCISNTICPTLTQQSEQATCNSEDIFPWGDFFPVYSTDYKLIFKNELCACCYGVLKYTPWLPMLECDDVRDIPISEHFNFLQQTNRLSSKCRVAFQGVDTPFWENQCFMGSIGTCPKTENVFLPVPDGVNLTRSEIVKACISGPYAPVKLIRRVYKNVFCAMCNVNVNVDRLQCFAGDDVISSRGFAGKEFVYLLDTTSIKKLTQSGKGDEVFPYSIVCLKNQSVWIDESCRTISCPSGQIRMDGVCSFPSKRWMSQNGIGVTVNLKYITSNTSVLRMLRNGKDMTDNIVNAFRKTSPWPSDWIITGILHTSEYDNFIPQLAVFLHTKISFPKKLMANIKTSLRRQWNIVLNGMGITFEQSFFKYSFLPGVRWMEYVPRWLRYVEESESFINVFINKSSSFEVILTPFTTMVPFSLNKLVICEQITLMKHEFTIMAGGLILLNKLSNKIMFSLEFESVEDENGEVFPRICLTDSPLILRRENNRASTVTALNMNLVWAMFILKWVLELHCAPIG